MVSPSSLPFTFTFRSFSLSLAFSAASALALPPSSSLRNLPSESTTAKPDLAQPRAQLRVWPARSLPLHMTSTRVPFQVSAKASAEKSEAANINFFIENSPLRGYEWIIPRQTALRRCAKNRAGENACPTTALQVLGLLWWGRRYDYFTPSHGRD